jgi:hypothetical protein
MKKKVPVLHTSLDRAWVVPIEHGDVRGRSFHSERDERLKRAYQHPAEWRLVLWCQEDYKGRRCNTFLGQVMATSEGTLWEAWLEGVTEWDLAFDEMALPGAQTAKMEAELHTRHQWLDDGVTDDLMARCKHHGPIPVARSSMAEALAGGKRFGHRRGGRLTFS